MPVFLDDIKFKNPLDSTPVNFSLLNVGDEVVIESTISVKTSTITSSDTPAIFNCTDGFFIPGVVKGIDFSKFHVGDTIQVYEYITNVDLGQYVIASIIDNTTIAFTTDVVFPGLPGVHDLSQAHIVFSLVNPITALFYKWNFIENAEASNFYSKIDGSVQMASASSLNPAGGGTNIPMQMMGGLEYQIGNVVVNEIALTATPVYTSTFKIVHTTRVTPIILDIQWDDLLNGIAPDYFFNAKCLKGIFYYEARYYLNDPNAPQTLQSDTTNGNSGWFNENWNNLPTNYFIENLQYSYLVGTTPTVIPSIQLDPTKTIDIQFNIRNIIDSPFVAGSTKLVLNFNKAPNDESEYTLNGRDVIHNFVWETAQLTANTTPTGVNGNNYSDLSIRSLKNCKAFYVNSSTITVRAHITVDVSMVSVFEESNVPQYMLWLSIQDYTKHGTNGDRVTLLVDAADVFYKTDFPDLMTIQSKLIPHDCPDYTTSFINREKFTEDELVAYSTLTVGTDKDVSTVELLKYTAKILMVNTVTQEEFIVDSKSINLPSAPIINLHQYFNISQAQPYHVPALEIRKNMIARTNTALSNNNYEFAYPFLNRWEYWVALAGVSGLFFNAAQPNNGMNEDWQHYINNFWTARYRYELNAKINGVPALYSSSVDFKIFDRDLPSENTTCVIKTYDPDSLTELVDGSGNKYILGYKNTLMRAVFTNTEDGFSFTDTTVVLGIEIKEQGGRYGKSRMSSKYVPDSDTFFIPLIGQTKVKLTNNGTFPLFPGTTLTAEVLIDFSQLDLSALDWKLTARVYGNTLSTIHGTVFYGQNYLGTQFVGLIATNPTPSETQVIAPVQLDCCSELIWKVLADAGSSDPLKNDINNFIWWFDKDAVDTAILTIVSSGGDEVELTGSSVYGTPYDYGFEIIPSVTVNGYNKKAVGYKIEWKKVLADLGEAAFYIRCDITTIFGASATYNSDSYCLKQYTADRANGTIRVEYYLNGLLGKNDNDEELNDYLSANWYNQHRFDGVFHFTNASYKTDEILYDNGQVDFVEDEQTPEYLMTLKPIPAFKHDVLRTDILMADEILITDYNTRNIDNYFQKKVRKNGSYDPKFYPLKSKLGSIELKFKQEYNNLKKFRS